MHGKATSSIASGLRAGTEYQFTVAAENAAGRGPWSAAIVAVTLPANDKPDAPTGAPTFVHTSSCDAITLHAGIQLNSGCAAQASLKLEVAPAGQAKIQWRTAVEAFTTVEAQALGLVPASAYIFRLQSRNAAGVSDPGPASSPMLSGGVSDALRKPPQVEALSSSEYRVHWDENVPRACEVPFALMWRLEYRRTSEGKHTWQTILDSSPVTQHQPQLRCPMGCLFRVVAVNLEGWSETSEASESLATVALHPPTQGAARLELLVSVPNPSLPKTQLHQQLELDLSQALKVGKARVHCVEVRESSVSLDQAVVFDLLPSPHAHLAGGAKKPSDATESNSLWSEPMEEPLRMAQDLAMQLLDPVSALRSTPSFSHVDVLAGLMQLDATGAVSRMGAWVPPPAAPPHAPQMLSATHSGWPWLLLGGAAMLCARRARSKMSSMHGYTSILATRHDGSELEPLPHNMGEEIEVFDDCANTESEIGLRTAPLQESVEADKCLPNSLVGSAQVAPACSSYQPALPSPKLDATVHLAEPVKPLLVEAAPVSTGLPSRATSSMASSASVSTFEQRTIMPVIPPPPSSRASSLPAPIQPTVAARAPTPPPPDISSGDGFEEVEAGAKLPPPKLAPLLSKPEEFDIEAPYHEVAEAHTAVEEVPPPPVPLGATLDDDDDALSAASLYLPSKWLENPILKVEHIQSTSTSRICTDDGFEGAEANARRTRASEMSDTTEAVLETPLPTRGSHGNAPTRKREADSGPRLHGGPSCARPLI